MPYMPPTFRLTCNIFRGKAGGPFPIAVADLTVSCQLRFPGLRSMVTGTAINFTDMLILLPKQTDVRAAGFGTNADAIECPAGTGRYYVVKMVDDVAKGFPNEYRVAICTWQQNSANGWPYPTP